MTDGFGDRGAAITPEIQTGCGGRIRTADLQVMSLVSYYFSTPRYMVGVQGFEPWTPWSQTRCATRLRHTPKKIYVPSVPGCQSQVLYYCLPKDLPRYLATHTEVVIVSLLWYLGLDSNQYRSPCKGDVSPLYAPRLLYSLKY